MIWSVKGAGFTGQSNTCHLIGTVRESGASKPILAERGKGLGKKLLPGMKKNPSSGVLREPSQEREKSDFKLPKLLSIIITTIGKYSLVQAL